MKPSIGLLTLLTLMPAAPAAVMAVGTGSFPPGSPLIDFTGLADGTEVNGLVVNGVQFTNNSFLGVPRNGQVIIDDGYGTTTNIDPPNIFYLFNNPAILGVLLPSPATLFGYGFALDTGAPNATTISLFMGSTPVGSLSYPTTPDPLAPLVGGGFAGIQSTIPFDRAQITFDPMPTDFFAVDNIRYSATAFTTPEPSMAPLFLAALALAAAKLHSRQRHKASHAAWRRIEPTFR
jgi:hypothetical protein